MRILTALIGGMIGGLIGAAIWAGISYATNYEIGWIAWGVGFLVGLGVRMGAQEWEGFAPGVLAVVIAMLAILGGKYATVSMLISKLDKVGPGINITAENIQTSLAYEIVKERTDAKQPVAWPPGKSAETAETIKDFPADIQQAAVKRWDELGAAVQQQRIETEKKQMQEFQQQFKGIIRQAAFKASFGAMDLLFFALAAFTAFKLGSGASGDDD